MAGCHRGPSPRGHAIDLPFDQDSAHCYEKLAGLGDTHRQGFAELAAVAREELPLSERLSRLLALHADVLRRGSEEPVRRGPSAEDIYLCCVYDLLAALFAEETRSILASGQPPGDQRARLSAVLDALQAIPWQGPLWNEVEKPKIQRRVSEALRGLR